jgi:benzoate/toluate 1,2-dioxygenase subunit beta
MITIDQAAELLHREAHCLDTRHWDDWLALYWPHATFWMPAWVDEQTLGRSPEHDLSLIYCESRAGLEDRIWRLRSGLSVACEDLARTTHLLSSVMLEPEAAQRAGGPAGAAMPESAPQECARIASNWTCHLYYPGRRSQHHFFGRYEHTLERHDGRWAIAAKKIILHNDLIPTMADFYCV